MLASTAMAIVSRRPAIDARVTVIPNIENMETVKNPFTSRPNIAITPSFL